MPCSTQNPQGGGDLEKTPLNAALGVFVTYGHTNNRPNPWPLTTAPLYDSRFLWVRSSGEAQLVLVPFHEITVKISAQA